MYSFIYRWKLKIHDDVIKKFYVTRICLFEYARLLSVLNLLIIEKI